MSTLRDRLTAAIHTATKSWDEPLDEVHDVPQIVNAVLGEGITPTGEQWDTLSERLSVALGDDDEADAAFGIVEAWLAGVTR